MLKSLKNVIICIKKDRYDFSERVIDATIRILMLLHLLRFQGFLL